MLHPASCLGGSLHALPEWTQSSSQKLDILTATLNLSPSQEGQGKGAFIQEWSWQAADPAVVGHLGQQMTVGNVKLSWAVSYSAGWISWSTDLIVWKWGSPFPQGSCPGRYLLTPNPTGFCPVSSWAALSNHLSEWVQCRYHFLWVPLLSYLHLARKIPYTFLCSLGREAPPLSPPSLGWAAFQKCAPYLAREGAQKFIENRHLLYD